MRLSKQELVAEKIALLLLTLPEDECDPDRTYEMVANDATDMAYRINRAKTNASWREIPGRPYFNERMARIRKKVKL